MAGQTLTERRRIVIRISLEILLPAAGFAVGVGFATGNWPTAVLTGLAISGAIGVLDRLDRIFLRPRLKHLARDWLQVGLQMGLSAFDHIVGALLALFICQRLLGFQVVPSAAWIALGAMVIAFPIIHGTEMILRYYRQLREKEQLGERLRALATQAELKALKAQINPHFLFNTLNTIAQLIHSDTTQAEATVERLAEMFRYMLAGSERGLVPLEEELAFVDGYLEIEQARFGERLHVVREVDPEALCVPVPSLILQPLVENAVRHGRGEEGSVDLTLRVQHQGDTVVIAVADQGPGMPPGHRVGAGHGVGLRNVDERLRKTCGEAYALEIGKNEPRGVVVTVRVPVSGEVAGCASI